MFFVCDMELPEISKAAVQKVDVAFVFRLDYCVNLVYNKKKDDTETSMKRLDGNWMKQKDFVKKLIEGGFVFERHGNNHDIYVRGTERESVPRHNEINETLAKAVLRRRGLA